TPAPRPANVGPGRQAQRGGEGILETMTARTARPAEPVYDFRDVTEADLPMLAAWLAEPHVAEWWDDAIEVSLAGIREAMESIDTEPLIVELDGRPIAYIQSYDPHMEDDHPYQDQPFG